MLRLWHPTQLHPSQVWFILKQSQYNFRHFVFLQLQNTFLFPFAVFSTCTAFLWESLFYFGYAVLRFWLPPFSYILRVVYSIWFYSYFLLSSSDISIISDSYYECYESSYYPRSQSIIPEIGRCPSSICSR